MDTEIRIFQNALDFKEVRVRECMVPRKEIVAIEASQGINKLNRLFIETKLSKILVFRDSIDNIIGFVHSSEMFKQPKDILEVLLPVSIVPEVMTANELLKLFTNQHRSIAVVVDEFGGTSGMVTIEDVMEEIFGEIQDEHDSPDETEKKISENEYHFSGRLEIDYLNKEYELNIPEHELLKRWVDLFTTTTRTFQPPEKKLLFRLSPSRFSKLRTTRIEQIRLRIDRES